MIEKLKTPKSINWDDTPEAMLERHYIITDVYEKINELVDAVNELQAQVAILQEHAHPTATTEPTDPYAEQRRWIGKACWFWDSGAKTKAFGKLSHVDTEYNDAPFQTNFGQWYEHCEPVKPNDDIIFKE